MPGRNGADNKFGLTPYIVGPVLGDGCNYDTIQSAIDDAFAAGGGVVGIRPSLTPYVENLTLRAGVELFGFDVDGRLPSTLSKVAVQGNHTFALAAGFGACLAQYINFSCVSGDTFTLNATGVSQVILAVKFCGLEAFTLAGQRAVVLNADAGCGAQFSTDNANINSSSHNFECIGAGSQAAFMSLGSSNSQSGNTFELTAGNGSLQGQNTQMNGLYICNFNTANGNASFTHTDLNSGQEAVLFAAGGGQAVFTHCNVVSSAVSGNWVDGASGQVTFGDILLGGSAHGIGATITQQKIDWQPYAETAAGPVGSNRGTSSFDNIYFTVTDGWVSLAFTPLTFTWVNQAASTTVSSSQGNFITAAGVTLTLPAIASQGDTVAFKDPVGFAPYVIQANAGQTLQVANQTSAVAGTATSSQIGDAMELTYYAALNIWCANSVVGNWLVV